jgi:AcrR family transcriptional regulator
LSITIEQKSPGRPRDIQCSNRITRAALELLADVGYDRLSMESVAERAQTSKATLYRRWSSKAELVAAAISDVETTYESGATIAHGRDRLVEQLSAFFGVDDPIRQQVLVGLSSALGRHPELAAAVQATFDSRQCRDAAKHLGANHAESDLIADLAPALLFYRLLFRGERITRERIERVVDTLVVPISECASSRDHQEGTATNG